MPSHRKCLIWDFDGTLGFRTGKWSGTMIQVLRRFADREVDIEMVRPYMQKGFPWDDPDRANPPMVPADDWWDVLLPLFSEAFVGCGVPLPEARSLAGKVRQVYTDIAEWKLFDDTKDVLSDLSQEGWTHAILSNHVPELPSLINGLGLSPLIHCTINSAETGFEKPHPGAFQAALTALDHPSEVWMIGDNVRADVAGAESVGLRAILVRGEDPRALHCAKTLRDVRKFIA